MLCFCTLNTIKNIYNKEWDCECFYTLIKQTFQNPSQDGGRSKISHWRTELKWQKHATFTHLFSPPLSSYFCKNAATISLLKKIQSLNLQCLQDFLLHLLILLTYCLCCHSKLAPNLMEWMFLHECQIDINPNRINIWSSWGIAGFITASLNRKRTTEHAVA